MRVLAIDSSSTVASVAIVEEEKVVGEYTINNKITHSQTLLPMIDQMFKISETTPESIDAIAITSGPGSFTGLRIGSATAKGLGQALKKPLVAIPTLEAMAYNFYETDRIICPIMDARRNQTYTAAYKLENGELKELIEGCAISVNELADKLNELNAPVIFVGDGIPVFKEYLEEKLGSKALFAPAHLNRQKAGSVGALALKYLSEGKIVTADEFRPDYFRKSQAEREMEEKLNNAEQIQN